MLGAPLGGTIRGGQYGLDSGAVRSIWPPNFGLGAGSCLPLIVVVALGEPGADLDRLAGPEPPPDLVALLAEEVRRRLVQLPGDDLRDVAMARLEGDTVAEAATRLGISRRAVERKLRLIRQVWDESKA